MNALIWLLPGVVLIALGVAVFRSARKRALESIRRNWGVGQPHEHDLDAILTSHRSRCTELGQLNVLDDRTWNDLLLTEVFIGIDRTESTLGQHALYHRLRTAPTDDARSAFGALVRHLSQTADVRERAQLALARLRDPHGYDLWWLARPDAVSVPVWFVVFPILSVIFLALLVLAWRFPQLGPLILIAVACNVILHYTILNRISSATGAFRQLAPIVATAQALQFLKGGDFDAVIAPLTRETPNLQRLKTISRWVSGDPFMLSVSTNQLAALAGDLVNVVFDYLNLILPLTATGLFFGAADLRTRGPGLLGVIAALGDIDAAVSVASVRAGRSDWTTPAFLPAGSPATIVDARHPLVNAAVPNSITLAPGAGVLVTGSNMSGKSTFLRTMGVTAVLAQTIHTCFAAEYSAPAFCVRSCIGRSDDLIGGKSYYLVEVESLLGLVTKSEEPAPHLFLLDELFRGTNAVERIAAGDAVLIELIAGPGGAKPHVVLAATHDGELVDLLAGLYRPCHFGDAIGDEGLTFDYRLKPGRATSRNAIALLQLNGAPSALIERALACAAALDRKRGTLGP